MPRQLKLPSIILAVVYLEQCLSLPMVDSKLNALIVERSLIILKYKGITPVLVMVGITESSCELDERDGRGRDGG